MVLIFCSYIRFALTIESNVQASFGSKLANKSIVVKYSKYNKKKNWQALHYKVFFVVYIKIRKMNFLHYGLFYACFNPGLKLGGHKGIRKCNFFAILSAFLLVMGCIDVVGVEVVKLVDDVYVHVIFFLEWTILAILLLTISVGTRLACSYNRHNFTT